MTTIDGLPFTVLTNLKLDRLLADEITPGSIANVQYIYKESDFPNPVGGVITLENKAYNIVGLVSVDNKIKPPSGNACRIFSDNAGSNGLNYTGTGALFENVALDGGVFTIDNLICNAPAGIIFDIASATSGIVSVTTSSLTNALDLGQILTVGISIKFNAIQDFDQGLSFSGNNGLSFSENSILNTRNAVGCIFVEVKGAQKQILINDNFIDTSGANETIFDIDAVSTTTGAVAVGNGVDISSGGVVFDPAGKDQTDIDWKFSANAGIPDSASTCGMCVPAGVPAAIVTITDIGVPVVINDASTGETNIWDLSDQERFEIDVSTGTITYIGNDTAAFQVNARATVEKTGGGTDRVSLFVLINGSEGICGGGSTDNPTATGVTTFRRATLSTNDVLTLAVANEDTMDNIEIFSAFISVGQ